MQESCPYGSERGAKRNLRPYRDSTIWFEKSLHLLTAGFGTFETSDDVRESGAIGGIADIARTQRNRQK